MDNPEFQEWLGSRPTISLASIAEVNLQSTAVKFLLESAYARGALDMHKKMAHVLEAKRGSR